MEIKDYSKEISVYVNSYLSETGSLMQAFTLYVMNEMQEKANLGEICACYDISKAKNGRTGEINGFAISLSGEKVTLFATIYKQQQGDEILTISSHEYQKVVNKLKNYYINATKNNYVDMPKNSDKYRICEYIANKQDVIATVQLIVISNCFIPNFKQPSFELEGRNISFVTWDISQLYNNVYSDSDRVDIVIDFENDDIFKDFALPFVKMKSGVDNYDVYVLIVPGDFLRTAYERYNIDLLQSNLRYFKGETKINKGMYNTIEKSPHRFLAYNNGLTTIATSVESKKNIEGIDVITRLSGFQIVNGGQTTACLYMAKKKYPKADLSKVFVQMKLIVINEGLSDMLPDITQFSNSQNKIPNSDFSSNSEFCLKVAEMSKTIYAPDPSGLGNNTHWYFNKFAKQWQVSKDRLVDKELKEAFVKRNPERQIFDKILMSKAYNSWNLLPYAVAKGGQYCFKTFVENTTSNEKIDRLFFEDLIAQIILFKYLEKESTVFASFKDHRSLVIPYTISFLNLFTSGKFSLYKIWKKQAIDEKLKSFLDNLGPQVYHLLKTSTREGQALRTYCGVQKNWAVLQKHQFDLTLIGTIKHWYKDAGEDEYRNESLKSVVSDEDRKRVMQYGAKFWSGFSCHTDILPPKAIDDISSLITALSSERIPKDDIVFKALEYLAIFEESGLKIEDVKAESTISDNVVITNIVDYKARIKQVPPNDHDLIKELAKRCTDVGEVSILMKVLTSNKSYSRKDYEIACKTLDEINRKFNTKY